LKKKVLEFLSDLPTEVGEENKMLVLELGRVNV
jgi:hypothetical protein